MIDDLPEMIGWMKGRERRRGSLLGVASDVALRQCFLEFSNLSFGEVGVVFEPKRAGQLVARA